MIIKGIGNQKILSDKFNSLPSLIYINKIEQPIISKEINLTMKKM